MQVLIVLQELITQLMVLKVLPNEDLVQFLNIVQVGKFKVLAIQDTFEIVEQMLLTMIQRNVLKMHIEKLEQQLQ